MSTTNSATAAWLTQEAFDRLKAELDHLSGPGRAEIVQKIEAARQEGDLKENGGYHAAKEEQGKIEARIRQLTALLRDAHVGESPADDGIVEPGMIVVAKIAGDEETFLLGSREIAGDSDLDVFSEKSPAGCCHRRPQGGRQAQLHRPERQGHHGGDHLRQAVRRLTPVHLQPQRTTPALPTREGRRRLLCRGRCVSVRCRRVRYCLVRSVPARGTLRSRAASTPPTAPPRCACQET